VRGLATVLPLLAVLALAGCKSNADPESPGGQSAGSAGSQGLVSEQDVSRILDAERAINAFCAKPTSTAGLRPAVTTLIQVYRLDPQDIFKYGGASEALSMKQVLERQSGRLRKCGAPELAAQLDRVGAPSGA
jgi:hypothetical protein